MSDATLDASPRPRAAASDLYRAVWRWHFYAGLFVLPFLITLAVTGAAYLFRDEIDAIIHADIKRVEVAQTGTLSPEAIVASAVTAVPGRAVKYTDPPTAAASAEVTVATDDGRRMAVYVNPYEGYVLGARPDRRRQLAAIFCGFEDRKNLLDARLPEARAMFGG